MDIRKTICSDPLYGPNGPRLDMAKCCECGFVGKISEFYESVEGGHEEPQHVVHDCLRCQDGFVEEYFPSEESLAEWEARKE